MKRILHSLHGRFFGTTDTGGLMAPKGLILGEYGSQFASPAPDRVVIFDEFEGAAILGMWAVAKGSDGAAANFAISPLQNGVVLATTGAGAGATMAVNGVQISGELNYKANAGELEFEARVQMAAITTVSVFVGLTNQRAALQAPANGTGGGNGVTFNAADCVGVLFDTTMTLADWWLVGQAASVPATSQDSTFAPVAATYETWHISVDALGGATFFRNGTQVGTRMAGAVTPTVLVCPAVTGFRRSAASTTLQADYLYAAGTRV